MPTTTFRYSRDEPSSPLGDASRGDEGELTRLDGDKDGIACEEA